MINYSTFEILAISIWTGFMMYYMYESDSYGMAASLFMLCLILTIVSIRSIHKAIRNEIEEDEIDHVTYDNHE